MSVSRDFIDKAKKAYRDELESAIIYSMIAGRLKGKPISEKLLRIAHIESEHAGFWAQILRKYGVDPETVKPSKTKIFMYKLLFPIIGFGLTLKLLESGESEAIKMYSDLLESPNLNEKEKEWLKKIIADELMHEESFIEEESKIKEFLDHVRDAVLGMNDGLVEILSVSAGLAGAYGDPLNVALGGLIVGIAGSLSMGIGAYISVKAQREVRMSVLHRVIGAVKSIPEKLVETLSKIISSRGYSKDTVEKILNDASRNKELLKKLVVEEKYGIKEEMIENPAKSGLITGLFYIVGAIIPLIPYFLRLPIIISLPLSLLFAGLMLSIVGFLIALSAGLNIKKKMIELLIGGLGAAGLTYLIGLIASTLLGINVG
ncbi:VIT1/CCC1 transporter family protein [Staphylothermus hellenicus]|uniref:Rubrerythrin diiron-binding domain-containing protein n=1 Tax=Staphylothermus hellenicus (strain DSM 12710 / JCM 10830 / BK20S6-10-b1 / P8) TaxID=591019 RepID=D7D7Y1_STAHD|nr:VIT1/CCC1 transporter family protein [Staphylothermus hellenicus]ADI31877.1 protein of unknown function DUF125 transmembrane [Staphylothermus hellenicus DSM 12710]